MGGGTQLVSDARWWVGLVTGCLVLAGLACLGRWARGRQLERALRSAEAPIPRREPSPPPSAALGSDRLAPLRRAWVRAGQVPRRLVAIVRLRWSLRGSADLGVECEHFLAGTYEDHLVLQGRPVPPWVHVNGVAHGDVELLASMAQQVTTADLGEAVTSWDLAQAHMAAELLRVAATSSLSTVELQRTALVPLESMVAASGRVAGGPAEHPERLLALVVAVLHHRSSPSTADGST